MLPQNDLVVELHLIALESGSTPTEVLCQSMVLVTVFSGIYRGDDGTVRLHRRGIASLSAAMGEYCCEIPNANNIIHRLCVHFSKFIIMHNVYNN